MTVSIENESGEPSNSRESPVSFDDKNSLSGKDGLVWATFDARQAEIIQNALLAQNIHSEIKKYSVKDTRLILVFVTNQTDVNPAIDFIWRSKSGLQLSTDWSYPAGEINKSFEHWLSGQ